MLHKIQKIGIALTINIFLLPIAINGRVEARQTRQELAQRKAALEQQKAEVMKELSKDAASLYGNADKIVNGFIDLNKATLPGTVGTGATIYDIIDKLGQAKEAFKSGDKKEFVQALRETGTTAITEALTHVKRIGEVVNIIVRGAEATSATKGLVAEVNEFRNTSNTHGEHIKRLREINRELQSVNEELSRFSNISKATREGLRKETDSIRSEQERIEQQIEAATVDDKELDDALDLIDFWDLKGDRAFHKLEELQRLAQRYPDIRRAYEGAFATPDATPKSNDESFTVSDLDCPETAKWLAEFENNYREEIAATEKEVKYGESWVAHFEAERDQIGIKNWKEYVQYYIGKLKDARNQLPKHRLEAKEKCQREKRER